MVPLASPGTRTSDWVSRILTSDARASSMLLSQRWKLRTAGKLSIVKLEKVSPVKR